MRIAHRGLLSLLSILGMAVPTWSLPPAVTAAAKAATGREPSPGTDKPVSAKEDARTRTLAGLPDKETKDAPSSAASEPSAPDKLAEPPKTGKPIPAPQMPPLDPGPPAPSLQGTGTPERGPESPVHFLGELKPVPHDARFVAPPVLIPGADAWVLVIDAMGRPLAKVSLIADGTIVNTDDSGQATIRAQGQSLELYLLDHHKRIVQRATFSAANGVLAQSQQTGMLLNKLSQLHPVKLAAPQITYAPVVLEKDQVIVIYGQNFSAKPGEDQLVIDGYECDILGTSPACIVAKAPDRLSIGPLRELYVRSKDESSSVQEVDVVRCELITRERVLEPNRPYAGSLEVLGTNFPCLVQLQNNRSAEVQLKANDRQLPARSSMLTPGGDQNRIPVSISVTAKLMPAVTAKLEPDHALAMASDDLADPQLLALHKNAVMGEVTRIKRRLTAIENRIEHVKRQVAIAEDAGKSEAESRQLANRQARLQSMLSTRRVLFEVLGGTEEEFRQALDAARAAGTTAAPPPAPAPATTTPPQP